MAFDQWPKKSFALAQKRKAPEIRQKALSADFGNKGSEKAVRPQVKVNWVSFKLLSKGMLRVVTVTELPTKQLLTMASSKNKEYARNAFLKCSSLGLGISPELRLWESLNPYHGSKQSWYKQGAQCSPQAENKPRYAPIRPKGCRAEEKDIEEWLRMPQLLKHGKRKDWNRGRWIRIHS